MTRKIILFIKKKELLYRVMIEKKNSKDIGDWGEKEAERYLLSKKHKIVAKNFSAYQGEIDIISLLNGVLIFTEVRTRLSDNVESAVNSISSGKQRRIQKTAMYYLKKNNLEHYQIRFDIIVITLDENKKTKLLHWEEAF